MTPKEKAAELFEKFYKQLVGTTTGPKFRAKNCALIAVDEIIKSNPSRLEYAGLGRIKRIENGDYWQQVKEEIEKL